MPKPVDIRKSRPPDIAGKEIFEALGEVVGVDEVQQVAAELIVGFVVEAPDSGVLDRPVHALDLAVGPRVFGFGQTVIDAGEGAGIFDAAATRP